MSGVIHALIQDDEDFSESVPLVLIHDGGGTTIKYYFLDELERHVWGIANETLVDETAWPGGIKQLARTYVDLIRAELAQGPVIIGGWSVGGLIALEMSKMLAQDTKHSPLGVVMIDTFYPAAGDAAFDRNAATIEWGEATTEESKQITLKSMENSFRFARQWSEDAPKEDDGLGTSPPVILLTAGGEGSVPISEQKDRLLGWDKYQSRFFAHVRGVPGHHYNLFADQNIDGLTKALSEACSILEESSQQA